MKIAIAAPSPIPFEVGGAEKLWWGLSNYINKYTTHHCELLKYPTREDNFWNLINSYQFYSELDLSHFDMLITGKYPCWMINHPNHHLYMLHCLRGLYDTYHLMNLPKKVSTDHQAVLKILDMMNKFDIPLPDFFSALHELKNDDKKVPEELFDFPGPFIRKIVHYLDKHGMQQVKRFLAISKTVSNRIEYFPNNRNVGVCYPPSNLTNFSHKSGKYFFTASRLDDPKRIKMLIKAYLQTKTSIPLKVAGAGPLEKELKKLSRNDHRIEFLGFVSDVNLIDFYANAYAVIFIPYDEDYGLITIEAMMCGKPVLTCSDSGGVTEFVKDGETGLVCEPSVKKIANNIELIANNRAFAAKLGAQASKQVDFITWDNCVKILLEEEKLASSQKMKKITVVTTYPVFPPRGGGQNRIFYLYKELAKNFKIKIISLAHENELSATKEIAPNLWEIRIPKSREHARKEWLIEEKIGIPVTDIAMLYLYEETSEYVEAVKASLKDSDFAVNCHPYTFLLLKKHSKIPIVHESHNVEYLLKKQMLPDNDEAQKLLKKLFEIEKEACLNSKMTTVCAMDDAQKMKELYNLDLDKVVEVPNGVDPESVQFTSPLERKKIKKRLGFCGVKIVLFIGSWHKPNIDAIEKIFKMSEKLPSVKFIIIGSAGAFFSNKKTPRNVGFMGVVDDDVKALLLSIADVAINPMLAGSGTNLKMLDYILAGIPVISTKIGTRGLNLPERVVIECSVEEFSNYICQTNKFTNITLAHDYVNANFTWGKIGKQLERAIEKIKN